MKEVRKLSKMKNGEAVLTDEGTDPRTGPPQSTSTVGVEDAPNILSGQMVEDGDEESRAIRNEYIWTGQLKTREDYEATGLLIDLVAEKYDALNDSKLQKNKIWEEFAQIITNEGFKIADDLESAGKKCDQKWRNLKRTYINYNSRTPAPGKELRKPPPYFKKLELVLGNVSAKESPQPAKKRRIESPVILKIEGKFIPEEIPSSNKGILEDALQGKFTSTSGLSSVSVGSSVQEVPRPSVSAPSIVYTEPENVGNQILDVLHKFMKAEERRFEILRGLLKENMKEKRKVNNAFMEYLRSVTPNAAALKRKRDQEHD